MTHPHVHKSIPFILLAVTLASLPLLAHEGHGEGEIAPYDLDTPREVTPETAAHIGLQTAEVDFGSVEEVIQLTGVVHPVPDQVHSIASRVDGTILSVSVQVGDVVQKGDLLVEVESPQLAQSIYELRTLETEYFSLQYELARAKSRIDELGVEIEAAQQHASIAQAEYDRLDNNHGAVAVNVLSEKQAAAVKAQSEAKLKNIELTLARMQLESITRQAASMSQSKAALEQVIATMANLQPRRSAANIVSAGDTSLVASILDNQTDSVSLVRFYAPIDGVITKREVMTGQGIGAGDNLLTVAEYSRVQVEGELPESLVHRAGDILGKPVRIRRISNPGDGPIATGTVRFVSPVIDPIKRTTHVVVESDNPTGSLRDGLYVDIVVVIRAEDSAVVVPASAVITDGPVHFVFIKDGDFYQKQDINPGTRDDQVIEVLEGLVPGDVVVTRGVYSLTQLRPKVAAATSDEGSDG